MSPMGDKASSALPSQLFNFEIAYMSFLQNSRYLTGCFFTDSTGIFETRANQDLPAAGTTGVDNTVTTLQAAVNSEKRSQWLILVRPQGVMEVCEKLRLMTST